MTLKYVMNFKIEEIFKMNTKFSFTLPNLWIVNAYTITLSLIIALWKPIYEWSAIDWLIVLSPFIIEICLGVFILVIFLTVLIFKFLFRKD